jgi:hypothetical protein
MLTDGDLPAALHQARTPDEAATTAMLERLYEGFFIDRVDEEETLFEGVYPPEGVTYAGCFPGVDIVCDQRFMIDYPSRLPEELVAASQGRWLVSHAMHSVVDWLAFSVWGDGQLLRSLSLSPDSGILEDFGELLYFEDPYWAGQRPLDDDPDDEPYPLPFHPLQLGEDALRGLFGFVLEGEPRDGDVDTHAVHLLGYKITI